LFPGAGERARALGLWGAVSALDGTTGLRIPGALTGRVSWRWIFLINLPVAAVALALVPRLVAESRAARRARLNVPGALLTVAAALVVLGVVLIAALLRTARPGRRRSPDSKHVTDDRSGPRSLLSPGPLPA
jgi:MFS family permease